MNWFKLLSPYRALNTACHYKTHQLILYTLVCDQ